MKNIRLSKSLTLSNFTTLRVGGLAELLSEPKNESEVKELIRWSQSNNVQCQILGAGSNLLINDSGLEGLSVCLRRLQGSSINTKTGIIQALAGESIPTLARRAAKEGLHGLEWAVGIPGTVGGAIVMNAGAQGGCIANCLKAIKVIPIRGGKSFELTNKDLHFAYRYSKLQDEELVVLSAQFQLEPGHDPIQVIKLTNENLHHRISTQPYHLPSCGSIFRNPEPLKAGKLIENVGLKGYKIGGAEISKIHANFIVNQKAAKASHIKELIELVQTEVHKAYGVVLHPEVKKLGF